MAVMHDMARSFGIADAVPVKTDEGGESHRADTAPTGATVWHQEGSTCPWPLVDIVGVGGTGRPRTRSRPRLDEFSLAPPWRAEIPYPVSTRVRQRVCGAGWGVGDLMSVSVAVVVALVGAAASILAAVISVRAQQRVVRLKASLAGHLPLTCRRSLCGATWSGASLLPVR